MHVNSDGLVMTVPSVEVEMDCSIDTTAFPYDAQRCELEVMKTMTVIAGNKYNDSNEFRN